MIKRLLLIYNSFSRAEASQTSGTCFNKQFSFKCVRGVIAACSVRKRVNGVGGSNPLRRNIHFSLFQTFVPMRATAKC